LIVSIVGAAVLGVVVQFPGSVALILLGVLIYGVLLPGGWHGAALTVLTVLAFNLHKVFLYHTAYPFVFVLMISAFVHFGAQIPRATSQRAVALGAIFGAWFIWVVGQFVGAIPGQGLGLK